MVSLHKKLGYCYVTESKTGKFIYAHRVAAEELLKRGLLPGEVVHHINGNREDNSVSNLMVFKTQSDHVRYHNLKESQRETIQLEDGSYTCKEIHVRKNCPVCNELFIQKKEKQKYCSQYCTKKDQELLPINSEEDRIKLYKKVWDKPMTDVAKEYNVSDTAVKKKCIKYSIPFPRIGFWNKIKNNKLEGQFCPLLS